MGQAISQPSLATARPFPRPIGGTTRSAAQGAGFVALFVSGLYLWLRPGDGLVLWLHLLGGMVLVAALGPWLFRHVPTGRAHSRRAAFTQASWALLASYLIVLGSGLAMALPALVWLGGPLWSWPLWFWPRAISQALSFAHLWGSVLAAGGLLLHLAMRHWAQATGRGQR